VPASASHPFRVARFQNKTGGALERGPLACLAWIGRQQLSRKNLRRLGQLRRGLPADLDALRRALTR
jgi:hypothetical protein